MPGRSVILLEFYDTAFFEILFEIENVLDVRTPKTIDRLIIITHNTQIFVFSGQEPYDFILGVIGVLVFINKNITKPFLIRSRMPK